MKSEKRSESELNKEKREKERGSWSGEGEREKGGKDQMQERRVGKKITFLGN